MSISDADLDDLERLARAALEARAAPWQWERGELFVPDLPPIHFHGYVTTEGREFVAEAQDDCGSFIARADPLTILGLIERVQRADATLRDTRAEIDRFLMALEEYIPGSRGEIEAVGDLAAMVPSILRWACEDAADTES